jgi:hypothetical protein
MDTTDRARAIATGCLAAIALFLHASPNVSLRATAAAESPRSDPDLSHDAAFQEIETGPTPEPLTGDAGFPPAYLARSDVKAPHEYPPRSRIDAAMLDDAGANRLVLAGETSR